MDPNAHARLEKIESTIEKQKDYIRRVPDPDNRAAAEDHLITLVRLRDDLANKLQLRPPE
jgi:hypothetical protein